MEATARRVENGMHIVKDKEVMEQASYAYRKHYQGIGCESVEMAPHCHPDCSVLKRKNDPQ